MAVWLPEFSLDKAKSTIISAPAKETTFNAVKDLVDKDFDQLTADDIGKLGKTSEWTVVLLHALADRYAAKNWSPKTIDSKDIHDVGLFDRMRSWDQKADLQAKIAAMKEVVTVLQTKMNNQWASIASVTSKLVTEFTTLTTKTEQAVESVRTETQLRLGEVRWEQWMSEQARALRGYILGLSHETSEVNLESLVAIFWKDPNPLNGTESK